MSRVYKKILSLFGLAFVVAITVIAYGLPPAGEDASATQDVILGVRIVAEGTAEISAPADGTVLYDGNINNAVVDYSGAAIIEVRLVAPDGTTTVIYSFSGAIDQAGSATIPLNSYLSIYGTYALEVDGYTSGGSFISGDATQFSFHAITVTPSPDEGDGVRVFFGPVVCKLNVQVFPEGISSGTPLIDYSIDDLSVLPGYPNYVEIKIPGFAELDANQEYNVVITAFDCSGNPLEETEVTLNGVMGPPNTGTFTIFGLSLSRIDYLISGLTIFFLAVFFALFLVRRKKAAHN